MRDEPDCDEGQAQGPLIHPTLPLVPTGYWRVPRHILVFILFTWHQRIQRGLHLR